MKFRRIGCSGNRLLHYDFLGISEKIGLHEEEYSMTPSATQKFSDLIEGEGEGEMVFLTPVAGISIAGWLINT